MKQDSRHGVPTPASSRATKAVRFALLSFGVGVLVGQSVNSKNTMSEYFDKYGIALDEKSDTISRVTQKYGPIRSIALLGERNSGTSWMTEELKDCFESEGIRVTSGLTKDKHFFQKDDSTIPKLSTVVVAMFRNPYDWAAAMNRRPHHSPEHLGLDIEEFLTKPWTMERPERDLPYSKFPGPICQLGYSYKEVIPCLKAKNTPLKKPKINPGYSSRDPQYELRQNGSGLPYDSIMQLRQSKIRNLMSIKSWDWIADFTVVRYEDLLEQGTEALIKHIENVTGVETQCTPSPPAPERLSTYELEPRVTKLITSLLNWETEALVGYYKR
eukprot:scaffold25199_cov152-Cylindrotheca_fusiformis.AAC.1